MATHAVTFCPVIVSDQPQPIASGIDPTIVRIDRAARLCPGDRVVGRFPTATLQGLKAAAADSRITVVKYGVFASRPFTVRTHTTDVLGFVTLTFGLVFVPAGLSLLYISAARR